MIKLYICCLVLIIGSVEVGPDIDMKFHQEVMKIVSHDIPKSYFYCIISMVFKMNKNEIYEGHRGVLQAHSNLKVSEF